MAHRLGAVIVPPHESEDAYLDRVLDLFSEHRTVSPYRVESGEHWRTIVTSARTHYPEIYPAAMSDLEVLNDQAMTGERWTAAPGGEYVLWSMNNPDGEIDWWVIGGRYDGQLGTMNREAIATARERSARADGWPRLPLMVVTTDPELVGIDRRGLDGSQEAENAALEAWAATLHTALDRAPDDGHVVYIDIHV